MRKLTGIKIFSLFVVSAFCAASFQVGAASAPSPSSVSSSLSKALKSSAPGVTPAPYPTPTDREVAAAVDKGLEFLASIQEPDGSYVNNVGRKLGSGMGAYQVTRTDVGHVGVTALACMAFVAGGSAPYTGKYEKNVRNCLKYLLANQKASGQFVANGSRMYSHAFATMCLAEIYGMHHTNRVKRALTDAVNFIIKNQVAFGAEKGGWRYEPGQQDADMSITVCQVQALRAARTAGIKIDESHIQQARGYIVQSHRSSDGAFRYQPQRGYDRDSFALTAAGIVSLQSTGMYTNYKASNGERIDFERSIEYLHDSRPDAIARRFYEYNDLHFGFWYGHYYAAQAIRQYSHMDARLWEQWNNTNRKHFLAMQKSNGAWVDEVGQFRSTQNAYATAMACLVLSIPNDYLPIFQH